MLHRIRIAVLVLALSVAGAAMLAPYVWAQSTLGGGAGVSWRTDDAIIVKVNPPSDLRSGARKWFGIQVRGVGAAATAWTVELQVSLDGTNYATIATHSNTADSSDGDILWISTPAPALWFRSEITALTLGTATALSTTLIGVD